MTAAWLELGWPSLVAAAVLLVPGAAVIWASGVRWRWVYASAPLISTGLVASAAILGGAAGVTWNLGLVTVFTLLVAGVLVAVARRVPQVPDRATVTSGARGAVALVVALPFTAAVFVATYVRPVGDPEKIGQLQDTMMHANIVRFILDTDNGSSLHTGLMDKSADASTFYPSAWHDVVSLVVQVTGCSIPSAITAVTAVLVVVVVPCSAALLAVTLLGPARRVAFTAAAVSLAIGAFPWRFLSWGQLYSNLHGTAILAALVAVTLAVVAAWADASRRERIVMLLVVAIGGAGVAAAQPNTLFAYGTIVVWPIARAVSGAVPRRRSLVLAGIMAFFVAGWHVVYHLPFLERTVNTVWVPFESFPQAVGEVLLAGFNGGSGHLVPAALTLLGVLWWWRSGLPRWWLGVLGFFAIVYVFDASRDDLLRDLLTGFWYHDSNRVAAIVTVLMGPPLTFAVLTVWARLERRWADAPDRRTSIAGVLVVGVGVVALCWTPSMREQAQWINDSFKTDDAWMLSPEEEEFLDDVAAALPADALLANNPYDGSGLGYALEGLDLVFPVMDGNWLGVWSAEKSVLARDLDRLGTDEEVCEIAHELGVTHLVQLDDRPYSEQGTAPEWSGLRVGLFTPGFTPVLVDGERGLYAIDPC